MSMHVLDAGEMDVLGLTPVAAGAGSRGPTGTGVPTGPSLPNPFGPASNNSQSVVKFFTAWHPAAQQSGINITGSINQPLFDLNVHVKNSDPAGNSDVDASFAFWNIWHVREHPGSTLVHLDQSDYIWVRSTDNIQQLHINNSASPFFSMYRFPTNGPTANDPLAHWLHVPTPVTFHLDPGLGSTFYATFLNIATLGIEHVPEPSGVVLLSAGAVCTVVGTLFRRRRRKLVA
jgi:hypothetical protein